MPARSIACALALHALAPLAPGAASQEPSAPPPLALLDVFELEWADDPQLAPDGARVAYVRRGFDVMSDQATSSLWVADVDGARHRPLTDGDAEARSPRWSPTGDRLAYVSEAGGTQALWMRWNDSGQRARISSLREAPADVAWSPDGRWLAFTMLVEDAPEPFAELPKAPEGAQWAAPARVVRRLEYRADGRGYLPDARRQVFVLPAEGGTPRQLTDGPYDHGGPLAWTPDGARILFGANRHEDGELDPLNTELYAVAVDSGAITALTDRQGPDRGPAVSPDGARVAWLGFDDRLQGYQVTELYVMELDGGRPRSLTAALDRDVQDPRWSPEGDGLQFLYDDRGDTRLAFVDLDGRVTVLAEGVGGTSLGRPYASGAHDVGPAGRFAFTYTTPARPADLATGVRGAEEGLLLTTLNEELLGRRALAEVRPLEVRSSHDGRPIQAWLARPAGAAPDAELPLVLEIHGGPFANYGARFSAEVQLYAAAGYAVLYANPRGSTSYGAEFGNLIHHAYPGYDYDDLMSCVDAALGAGGVDPGRLFVTGGSGGGVLTAWIVGKTDRFRAAVVAKPVIHWTSFALTADAYAFFYKYWFPAPPWEDPEHYWRRSPLSLVGNVTTPTMLLTGERDYRTPISETEQYYQALKLRGVDTVMVRIPEASHGIAARPSQLVSKVAHVLRWFETHGGR